MFGYAHKSYADSLSEFGSPIELPCSGGWLLKRPIPASPLYDAMGCYPFFACQDWSKLQQDLEPLKDQLVTLALVTDPFGSYDQNLLNRCFDKVIPFKQHFVIDFDSPTRKISRHHAYYARKALGSVTIEVSKNPIQYLEEWTQLYAKLIDKHDLAGIKAFSKSSFEKQLKVPGIVLFRASSEGATVGFHLWYRQKEVAYHHLAAFNEEGYRLMASYAFMSFAIDYFSHDTRWLDLGGAASFSHDSEKGLWQFKKGWTNATQTVFFCGRIFNTQEYSKIVHATSTGATDYFPAYREGEFGKQSGRAQK